MIQNMTDEDRVFPVELPEGVYTDLNDPSFEVKGGKNSEVRLSPRAFVWLSRKN